jgi:hypothetical protein
VPAHYSLDPQLGRWVRKQRELFKNDKMDVEREAKLAKIGFEFSVQDKSNDEKWTLQFKKLQNYHGKYGHCELFRCQPFCVNP